MADVPALLLSFLFFRFASRRRFGFYDRPQSMQINCCENDSAEQKEETRNDEYNVARVAERARGAAMSRGGEEIAEATISQRLRST